MIIIPAKEKNMDDLTAVYQRYVDGDDSAFEKLITSYAYGLMLFINGYVHNLYSRVYLLRS
jgi:hypothetical protein